MGQLAAEYGVPTDSGTTYLTADHLGSTRLLTNSSGAVKKRYDYFPFGEDIQANLGRSTEDYGSGMYPSPPGVQALDFTGKERDAETGLDYFGARYMSAAQGRFTSPDAKQLSPRHDMSPLKWNRYVYVQNNPLGSVDPDGLDDYKVFITAPHAENGNWAAAAASAKEHGHTLTILKEEKPNIKAWTAALPEPHSRVAFAGHTTHEESGSERVMTGVVLANGRSAGTNSVERVLGAPASTERSMMEVPLPETTVSANTV